MKRMKQKMMATMMTFLGLALWLTACSVQDTPVYNALPVAERIVGTWYVSYEENGTIDVINNEEVTPTDYNRIVEIYEFRQNGTGIWNKYYFIGRQGLPFSHLGGGSGGLGAFKYTTTDDGTVNVTLFNTQDALSQEPYLPLERQLSVGRYYLKATVANGQTHDFTNANDNWLEIIAYWNFWLRGGLGQTDSKFLSDWENEDTVRIAGQADPVYTPWSGPEKWNIPDEIRMDVSKDNGWEMAFCLLNDPNAKNCHMFGLYNRYTGILKVYHFIINPTGYGNDLVYKVTGSSTDVNDKYPIYNMMEYGIPSNHAYGSSGDLKKNAKLYTGQIQQSSFTAFVTPYTDEDNRTPKPGWQCFYLDMSGYVPDGVDWKAGRKNIGQLNFSTQTREDNTVALNGALTGKLAGTVTNPEVIHHGGGSSTSGICTALTSLASLMNGGISSINAAYSLANNPKAQAKGGGQAMGTFGPYMAAAGFAMNITAAVLKSAGNEKPSWDEVIPGKIDLGLDATINLEGTIGGLTANAEGDVALTPELLAYGVDNKHLGTGVWGLADDPVVYISKEDLFSVNDHLNIAFANDSLRNEDIALSHVRLLSFFDPSSVKIKLNTSLFHNIRNLAVKTNYGVYADRQLGHTDSYRQFLGFGQRPSFNITAGDKSDVLVKIDNSTNMHLHCLYPDAALIKDFETKENCTLHTLPGNSNVRLYGQKYSLGGKEIVCYPQVYVPYTDKGVILDAVAPDFVVSVEVTFECDEGNMYYTKNFVPKVELIGHDDLAGWYDKLKAYSDKCAAEQPVATLANDASIQVRDAMSDIWLSRALKMLAVATGKAEGSTPDRKWLRYDILKDVTLEGILEKMPEVGKLNFVCLTQSSWRYPNNPLFIGITKDTYEIDEYHVMSQAILPSAYTPGLSNARKIGGSMHDEWDAFVKAFNTAGSGPLSKGYEYWIDHTHRSGLFDGVLYWDYFSYWDYNQKEESLYGSLIGKEKEKMLFFFDWTGDGIRDGGTVKKP